MRTGFAHGIPGSFPVVRAVTLKKKDDPLDVAFGNLRIWLDAKLGEVRPVAVFIEAQLPPGGSKRLKSSHANYTVTSQFHGVVRAGCFTFGIPCHPVAAATYRKAFTGRGRAGTREDTKLMMLEEAWRGGFLPRTCKDDNMADAAGLWVYGAAFIKRGHPWDDLRTTRVRAPANRSVRRSSAPSIANKPTLLLLR
jgi:hypothetical protein